MEVQLKHIYNRLKQMDWTTLPLGLKDGKTGLMFFFALYSEYAKSHRSRKLSAALLSELTGRYRNEPLGLLYGKLGIAWSLSVLEQKGILESDESLKENLSAIINELVYHYYFMPVQVTEDGIFDSGLYMLQQRCKEDSLQRYIMDEKLINLVDECERMLTFSVKYVYNSDDMPLSMFHSLLFFLQNMKEKKIYIHKAGLLISKVEEKYVWMKKKSLWDEYIYLSLQGKDILPTGLTDAELFRFMSELGFYSLLYGRRNIFFSAWKQLDKVYQGFNKRVFSFIKDAATPVSELYGWGYGLLQCKTDGYV